MRDNGGTQSSGQKEEPEGFVRWNEQKAGEAFFHLDKPRVERLSVVVTEISEAHQPGSKRGRVNINAQLGVPEALPVLTGPQPASSGSPLGRMSPHPQGHQDEHPQDAQVHQGSGSSSIRDSLLASLCFVVPWLPGCSQGSTLPPSAAPPTCSFSL